MIILQRPFRATIAGMQSSDLLHHVLIVEDEYAIADDVARTLCQHGFSPLRPVADPEAALAALDNSRVDFAIVDINLDGTISFKVAAELHKRAIPFLFLTGYETSVVPPEFAGVNVLQKPHDSDHIVAEIVRRRDATLAAS